MMTVEETYTLEVIMKKLGICKSWSRVADNWQNNKLSSDFRDSNSVNHW